MTDVSIERPVFVTMVTLAAIVLGLLAIGRLGLDLFPNTEFPIAVIVTPYPGAGPAEVEKEVTITLEDAVAGINGVTDLRTMSRQNVSQVIIMFDFDVDVKRAMSDVRDRVALVRNDLPQDVLEPIINRLDPGAVPILVYSISSQRDSIALTRYAEDIVRPSFEQLDGVGSATVQGGVEQEIRVELDQQKLDQHGLTVMTVAQKLGMETLDVPAGTLNLGARLESVKAVGQPASPEEMRQVVLMAQPDGSQVRLGDVGVVRDARERIETVTRLNGQPSLLLEIIKQGGVNTVEVVDRVEKRMGEFMQKVPSDIKITKVIDNSFFVRVNLDNLWHHLLFGGLFAILVIFLFMLDWRSTIISALALPVSVISTFFVMWQLGFTLNILSMMGITLSIGVLIDDSVVVRENIFRFLEMGHDPKTAAREGTKQIALAVLATTLTIVAVFVPVAFTGGMIGKMFTEFGITVAVAVMVSLVVSFTLDPMLSARVTQTVHDDHHERQRRHLLWGWLVRFYDWLGDAYRATLAWTLNHKLITGMIAGGIFIGSMSLVPLMGQEFFNRGDRGEFMVNLDLPAGSTFDETDAMARRVERLVGSDPQTRMIATTVQPDGRAGYVQMKVKMTSKTERAEPLTAILERLRLKLADIPGVEFAIREANMFEGGMEEAPITIFIMGPDYVKLGDIAQKMLAEVKLTPGIRDARMSYRPGATERLLSVDRTKAADRGVAFATVAMTLRTALEGQRVAKVARGEDDIDVRLLVEEPDRANLDALMALTVPNMMGQPVQLADLMTVEKSSVPGTIERYDRRRQIVIDANIHDRPMNEILVDLTARLDAVERPEGYDYKFMGEAERMQDAFANLALAMAIGVLFIFFVLGSQFESFVHPFTIMFALPLAIVGAVVALFLTGKAFGMAAFIGVILLMGLVTKNSILLVDYTNQLRDQGKDIIEALLEAGPTRLRPILMTSFAIILGMLPAAVSTAEGSEFSAPMAIAVIGGVLTSTFLTLIVVPVVYVVFDKVTLRGIRERRERKRAKAAAREEEAAAEA